MYKLIIPEGYQSNLSLRETEKAIKLIKDNFEKRFAAALNLERISAPLFVREGSGINDDLNGTERAVNFDIKSIQDTAVIIHSLAKWKRMALKTYHYNLGEGIYTDMNAIRRDDDVDNIHSIYVDQWDWELVLSQEQRTEEFLKDTVRKITACVADTLLDVREVFPQITAKINRDVYFIKSQELEDMFPKLSPKEREKEITRRYGTVFIMQIGDTLKSGVKHDGRSPDYDDWALNGDLLFWNEVMGEQLEISSMGIRVTPQSLKEQLAKNNCTERLKYNYHNLLVNGQLPLSIGGGIGQSRLCMLLLQKLHIGEVQVSLWPQEMLEDCLAKGIKIL